MGVGACGRGQVRLDVGAAEGVDGLLRIADDHQARLVEDGPDHLPLDRVGVLGLVYESDGVAPPQQLPGALPYHEVGQRVAGLHQAVVVGDHPGGPHPPRRQIPHLQGHLRPDTHPAFDLGGLGQEADVGGVGELLADGGEVFGGDRFDRAAAFLIGLAGGEAGHHQIAGGAADQHLVDLAGRRVGGQPGTEPELAEQPHGEAVDGEYLGPVEAVQGLAEPGGAALPILRASIEQDPHVLVDLAGGPAFEGA